MDKSVKLSIEAIDKSIAELTKMRNHLMGSIPLLERVSNGEWVIRKSENKYFKVNSKCTTICIVTLERNGLHTEIAGDRFNQEFRLAEKWEAEQHEAFLLGKKYAKENLTKSFEPQLPEFYMVTVRGIRGAKVRHETFEKAVEEATKFAKQENHIAHIMGVVAVVQPIQVQEPKTEYKLLKK